MLDVQLWLLTIIYTVNMIILKCISFQSLVVLGSLHRPIAHSQFDYFNVFYTSNFPYNWQNDTRSNKRNGKNNKFECNFLIIYRYLNLVKKKSEANLIAN